MMRRPPRSTLFPYAPLVRATGTTYSDAGLAANTSYSYRVRATDAAGNPSGYSNVASATTPAPIAGLVAAWGFNEGAGTTGGDASGNNHTGTVSGATWTTAGRGGGGRGVHGEGGGGDGAEHGGA